MKISENSLTWLMRFYPPMLFQRIWVKKIYKDFRGIEVKINKSLFTTNLGNSIFGGTIFTATDPFYALLFGQIFRNKGLKITVWLKSARIQYVKPGRTDLFYTIVISEEMIEEAGTVLAREGKFVKSYPIAIYDRNGVLCASADNEIYIRDLHFEKIQKG